MPEARTQVNCHTAGCRGWLGALLAAGDFIPAPHLVAGRDLYVTGAGAVMIRCSFCNRWVRVMRGERRLVLSPLPAGGSDACS